MIKNSLKTLQEKYGNVNRENSHNLAKFMKRRRIEQNRTLEDVSRGICSPSYLSKIENCQVEVDAYYFQSLFEKLDLKYENVKNERKTMFFNKLIEFYLLERYDLLEEKVKSMVNGSSYCDTELELMVLLNNIVHKNYDEAEKLIQKLETIRNSLTKEELYLLSFLIIFYLVSTNQYVAACSQLEVLMKYPSDNQYFNIGVADLGVDIYFYLGKESLFFKCYHLLKEFQNSEMINTRMIIHNLQVLCMRAKNGDFNVLEDLLLEKTIINSNKIDEEKYIYYSALVYYYLEDFKKALEILNNGQETTRVLAVEALVLNKLCDFNKAVKFLGKIKNYDNYLKGEEVHQNYIEYIREKFEQYSYTKIQSYLKNVALPFTSKNHVFWVYDEEIKEYLKLSFELGKYKESIRFLIKLGELRFLKKD